MIVSVLQGIALGVVAAASPHDANTESDSRRFDVVGLQICLGDPGDAKPCDVTFYPPQKGAPDGDHTAVRMPVELSLFGKRLCIGEVPDAAACDVRLGTPDDRVEA